MSWNYRVTLTKLEEDGCVEYLASTNEVYYNEDSEPEAYSEAISTGCSESKLEALNDLKQYLELQLKAVQDVIDLNTDVFKPEDFFTED